MNDLPTTLTFYVTNVDAPLTIGMDIKKSITDTTSNPKSLSFIRPFDDRTRQLAIYESGNSKYTKRLRLAIAPLLPTTRGLLSKPPPIGTLRPTTLAKIINTTAHALTDQMIQICKNGGWLN